MTTEDRALALMSAVADELWKREGWSRGAAMRASEDRRREDEERAHGQATGFAVARELLRNAISEAKKAAEGASL